MHVFPSGQIDEIICLRLDTGDDVLASIEKTARERDIHTGVVISGIGTLDRAQLHHITHTDFPPKDQFVNYEGPIELLNIDGIIADYTPHLHTCISIKDQTMMGHLEPGCRILYLGEIVIAKFEGVRLTRRKNPDTNVNQLVSAE